MIYRTKTLILIITLLFCIKGNSQSHVKLYGEVVTASGEPASFAHVFVKEKNMGGITDIDGIFKYFISEDYYNDQLLISLVGYKPFEIQVKELVENPGMVLTLEENIIRLEDVTVYAPHKIMKEALSETFKDHNLGQYYSKSGVLTLVRQEGEDFTLLEEIGFNSYYRGMKDERPLIGYEPLAQRRSIDYSTFPYILARGVRRSYRIAYFFGASTEAPKK